MDGRFCRMKWKPKSTTAEALISSRMRLPAWGQGLVAVEGVVAEGNERCHTGMGSGQGAQGVVVVAVQMHVGVYQPRQHELALGVNDPVGGGQQMLRRHRHNLLALDRHGGVQHLRRRHNLPAANDGVNSRLCHDEPLAVWLVSDLRRV